MPVRLETTTIYAKITPRKGKHEMVMIDYDNKLVTCPSTLRTAVVMNGLSHFELFLVDIFQSQVLIDLKKRLGSEITD